MSQPPHPPPPFGPPPPPAPRPRTGLVVGLVVLAVAALAGIGVGAFVVADRMLDDDSPRAGTRTTAATDGTSPTDDSSPTDEATDPTAPTTGLTAPYSPTDDTGDDVHGDVEVADFPGDWDFKLGDVEHHATLDRSVDHATCAPVEKDAVLTSQRCEHAAQWVFTALGGKVRLTQLFLVFDTERHAKAAQTALDDKDLDLPAGSTFPSYAQGRWNSSVYGNIISVTVGTSRTEVDEKRLTSMVNYMNTDFRTALLFSF